MEHLKSGEVPALVTNLELMNILSKRLTTRKEEEEAAAALEHGSSSIESCAKRKNSKLRHRDYIENSVYEYLAHSPCAGVDIKKMPTLVSRLRGSKSKAQAKQAQAKSQAKSKSSLQRGETNENNNTVKFVKTEEGAEEQPAGQPIPIGTNEENSDINANANVNANINANLNQGYGLTDAETLQVLNLMPTEPVEIHLMIEDLSNRLDEDEQNSLLELISNYSS